MTIRIHALTTGHAVVKESVRRGRGSDLRRRTAVLTDRRWSGRLPIHCWLIEHPEGPILVDAGERAGARDPPVARMEVSRAEEIDEELARVGLTPRALRMIVITHAHADHIDGLDRLPADRVQIGEDELRLLRRADSRLTRRLLRTPLPREFDPAALRFAPEPFGAFDRSVPLTADGAVVAVPTPGHTPGHISVVVVIAGIHHFLAGDATYDQAQLLALRPDGLAPKAEPAVATMRRILRHAAGHPTVYLPSHDVDSADRLSRGEQLESG